MKNRIFAIISILLCISFFGCVTTDVKKTSQQPNTYFLTAATPMLADGLLNSLGERQAGKITVADLIGPGDAITGMGEHISEKISVKLFSSGRFSDFMERRQLKQVIAAIKMENSGYFDQETASRFGRMIGVDAMVVGTIQDLGTYFDVTVKIVQSETGTILAISDAIVAKDQTTAKLAAMKRTATLTIVVNPPTSGTVVAGGRQATLRNGTATFNGIPYGEYTVVISPDGYETVRKSVPIRAATEVLAEKLTARKRVVFRAEGTASISYQCDPKTENPCPPQTELKRRAIEVAKIHALQTLSQRMGVDVNTLSNAASGRLASEKVTTRSGAAISDIRFSQPVIKGDEVLVEITAQPR